MKFFKGVVVYRCVSRDILDGFGLKTRVIHFTLVQSVVLEVVNFNLEIDILEKQKSIA
jgi:hypothetical protein